MIQNPHLQKCAGAEWKQQEPLVCYTYTYIYVYKICADPQTKNQEKIKPNQKKTPAAETWPKIKLPRSFYFGKPLKPTTP